jgi:hypothetical protein
MTSLPKRRKSKPMGCNSAPQIRSSSHLAWIRGFDCAANDGTCSIRMEAAHVRTGTDGGTALKPGDNWTIPLCSLHHGEQHAKGERWFEAQYKIDMKAIALELWRRSPHNRLKVNP